ncbi:MAG: hypothetical protein WBQ54_02195, partial [Pseudolabrys sp.]
MKAMVARCLSIPFWPRRLVAASSSLICGEADVDCQTPFSFPFVYHQCATQGNAKTLIYKELKFPEELGGNMVEPRGFEPLTS